MAFNIEYTYTSEWGGGTGSATFDTSLDFFNSSTRTTLQDKITKIVLSGEVGCQLGCVQLFKDYTYLTSADFSALNIFNDIDNYATLAQMFEGCTALNEVVFCDCSDTEKEVATDSMFSGCTALESIDATGLKNVYTASGMFNSCVALKTIDISTWTYGAPVNLNNMFYGCSVLETIIFPENGLNLSKAKNLSYIFAGCTSLTTDLLLGGWTGANLCPVTTLEAAFNNTGSKTAGIKISLTGLNTTNVTTLKNAFYRCNAATIEVQNLDTSNVTTMYRAFGDTYYITELDLSSFDTSSATTLYAFLQSTNGAMGVTDKLTSVTLGEKFVATNLSESNGLSLMFAGRNGLTLLDLSNFYPNNSSLVATNMFRTCSSLATIYTDEDWHIGTGTGMFTDCTNLVGAISYDSTKTNATYANLTTGYFKVNAILIATGEMYESDTFTESSPFEQTFEGNNNLGLLRAWLEAIDQYSEIPNGSGVVSLKLDGRGFGTLSGLCAPIGDSENAMENLVEIDFSKLKICSSSSASNLFKNCTSLMTINLGCDLSSIKDCSGMFYGLSHGGSGKTLTFGSGLQPTNISYMFYNYNPYTKDTQLSKLDLSSIDLTEVTNASHAFDGCLMSDGIVLGAKSLNKCKDFSYTFANLIDGNITELDLDMLDTNVIEDAEGMFYNDIWLTTLYIRNMSMHDGKYTKDPIVKIFSGDTNLNTIYCNHNWYKEILNAGITAIETDETIFENTAFINKQPTAAQITKLGGNFIPSKTIVLNGDCMESLKVNGVQVNSVYVNNKKVF